MPSISESFNNKIDQVKLLVEIQNLSSDIASEDRTGIDLSSNFVRKCAGFAEKISSLGNLSPITFDGAFLFICAEFERTVRDLVERFVQDAIQKCDQYNHLPQTMRNWYLKGCANLILNISHPKFGHLNLEQVKISISKCQKNQSAGLIPEVFSDNEKNFWAEEIEGCFVQRLGIEKPWQKISRDEVFKGELGCSNEQTVERLAKDKLNKLLQRRNDIIHRGRTYYSASYSDVYESADFTKFLVSALERLLNNYLSGI